MSLTSHHRLLLTGAAGGLGKVMRQRLRLNCNILRISDLVDMEPAQEGEEVLKVDLAEAAAVNEMVQGCDAIVHLGGISTEQPWPGILRGNIIGVYNLYEAARLYGVKRIIFASSNHVMGYYKQSEVVDAMSPPRPDGLYGVSKAFGEDISRMYFDRYGIETACVRIGSSTPEPTDRRMLSTWLSHDDLYRLITACLSAPVVGHTIIYGTSNNASSWYDNRLAKHIGYKPEDSSDVYRTAVYEMTANPDLTNIVAIHQGGAFLKVGPF